MVPDVAGSSPVDRPILCKDFMNWLHALILGFVQGCTEFLPISSSAHLKILKTKLHIVGDSVFFDLACHLGTLVALCFYFRKDLRNICLSQPKKMIPYCIALLPLIPAYFLLKPVRDFASNPLFLGPLLFVTSIFLFLSRKKLSGAVQNPTVKDALWIGALQSMALIPGISRSASTITAALFRGLSVKEAVRFSFLLSIPAVLGGTFLEFIKLLKGSPSSTDMGASAIGFMTSAAVGFIAIRKAIPLLEKGCFKPFAWYCLIVAILLTMGLIW